jgi:hypothetical protein
MTSTNAGVRDRPRLRSGLARRAPGLAAPARTGQTRAGVTTVRGEQVVGDQPQDRQLAGACTTTGTASLALFKDEFEFLQEALHMLGGDHLHDWLYQLHDPADPDIAMTDEPGPVRNRLERVCESGHQGA